jgi:hypothetical protein
MMKSQKDESLDSFDVESFKAELEKTAPQIIAQMCDLFEVRTPRVTKKLRREMAEQMASGMELTLPHLKALEEVGGGTEQVDVVEGYRLLEGMIRQILRRTKTRLKPGEDAFDYILRNGGRMLRARYSVKRLKQYRLVRGGAERLIAAVLNRPGGQDAANQLTDEYLKKHFQQDMRYFNALEAREKRYRSLDLTRMTKNNITRLTEEYRDAAATFERRLRLLVGMHCIACGKAQSYADLRGRDYNALLQAVDSPNNPLLHFLRGAVNRHVRNALMHGGPSPSHSEGVLRFTDYSAWTKQEHEVVWTMGEFYRETRKLILTIVSVANLEMLFKYFCLYRMVAILRYLRDNPPSGSPAAGGTGTSRNKGAGVTLGRREKHQTL